MTRLVWRKQRYFSTTCATTTCATVILAFHHCTGSQQSASRGRVLAFYRIAPCLTNQNKHVSSCGQSRTKTSKVEFTWLFPLFCELGSQITAVFSYLDCSGDFMPLVDVTKTARNNGKKNISNLLQHYHALADKPDVKLLCRGNP